MKILVVEDEPQSVAWVGLAVCCCDGAYCAATELGFTAINSIAQRTGED
ncbi:MAG: hypothetical protein ACI86X_000808 [Moritella sp.]|jgi:hypothetical protein